MRVKFSDFKKTFFLNDRLTKCTLADFLTRSRKLNNLKDVCASAGIAAPALRLLSALHYIVSQRKSTF